MAMIGYGIIFDITEGRGYPFKELLAEIDDPAERQEFSDGIEQEDGEFYKYDADSFYDLISTVTYTDKTPHVWVGETAFVDKYYVILGSASQSTSSYGPIEVDLDKINPNNAEKEAFDAFVERVFPGIKPTIYMIKDGD